MSQSGNFEGSGALKRHGRGALRALLIQSGKKLLQVNNPLQKWGLAVAARRGRNKAAVAVARKLCVALWHVLMGHLIGAFERLDTLATKLSKFATEIGPGALTAFGYNNKADFVKKNLICYALILDRTTCLLRLGRCSGSHERAIMMGTR